MVTPLLNLIISQVANQPQDIVINTVATDTNVIVNSTSISRGRPFRRYYIHLTRLSLIEESLLQLE
jgi:hypothetical protein